MVELLDPTVSGVMGPAGLVVLIVLVGVGTYLMRATPLLAALLRYAEPEREENAGSSSNGLAGLLSLVGPAVIAALLVTSLIPDPATLGFLRNLVLNAVALVPAVVVAIRWKNPGLTVLIGVVSYLLVATIV